MDINDFLELPEDQQWEELWENGVWLENFKSIDCSFQLYSLYSFYVDVEIIGSRLIMFPFKGGDRLDKYNLGREV